MEANIKDDMGRNGQEEGMTERGGKLVCGKDGEGKVGR